MTRVAISAGQAVGTDPPACAAPRIRHEDAITTAVSLTRVTHAYRCGRQRVPALHEVSLTVAEGTFVALCGPSGSGKTTLLNVIGCLDRPASGEVRLLGEAIGALSDAGLARLRNRLIGFVFQSFNLVPVLTAFENIEYPLVLQGVARRERRARVACVLSQVGLAEVADRRPPELSAGQQERVAIARGLVTRPRIVLADEPTASLDSITGGAVVRLMKEMSRDQRTTVIMATHDPAVLEYADVVHTIRDGRLSAPAENRTQPAERLEA